MYITQLSAILHAQNKQLYIFLRTKLKLLNFLDKIIIILRCEIIEKCFESGYRSCSHAFIRKKKIFRNEVEIP